MQQQYLMSRCKLCKKYIRTWKLMPNRLRGIQPYRKNPTICNSCERAFPDVPINKGPITIYFSDIRGYTSLSEKLDPQELTHILNHYYSVSSDTVITHDGVVDKFIGDAVMALFGPIPVENHALAALKSAIEVQEKLADLRGNGIGIGIGIATGPALIGNVGGGDVKDFTAIGDTVNVASRLQSTAKEGEIILNRDAYSNVKNDIPQNFMIREDNLQLKGKSESVNAYILTKKP